MSVQIISQGRRAPNPITMMLTPESKSESAVSVEPFRESENSLKIVITSSFLTTSVLSVRTMVEYSVRSSRRTCSLLTLSITFRIFLSFDSDSLSCFLESLLLFMRSRIAAASSFLSSSRAAISIKFLLKCNRGERCHLG